ncbi:mCG1046133 [Mus musculus]|nr:mCG1046133 [Mus musculus]
MGAGSMWQRKLLTFWKPGNKEWDRKGWDPKCRFMNMLHGHAHSDLFPMMLLVEAEGSEIQSSSQRHTNGGTCIDSWLLKMMRVVTFLPGPCCWGRPLCGLLL